MSINALNALLSNNRLIVKSKKKISPKLITFNRPEAIHGVYGCFRLLLESNRRLNMEELVWQRCGPSAVETRTSGDPRIQSIKNYV